MAMQQISRMPAVTARPMMRLVPDSRPHTQAKAAGARRSSSSNGKGGKGRLLSGQCVGSAWWLGTAAASVVCSVVLAFEVFTSGTHTCSTYSYACALFTNASERNHCHEAERQHLRLEGHLTVVDTLQQRSNQQAKQVSQ
jgi:hypothetical protein